MRSRMGTGCAGYAWLDGCQARPPRRCFPAPGSVVVVAVVEPTATGLVPFGALLLLGTAAVLEGALSLLLVWFPVRRTRRSAPAAPTERGLKGRRETPSPFGSRRSFALGMRQVHDQAPSAKVRRSKLIGRRLGRLGTRHRDEAEAALPAIGVHR